QPVIGGRRAVLALRLVGAGEVRQIHRPPQAGGTGVVGASNAVPETPVVHGEVAGLGLNADLGRVVTVPDEVRLSEAHRPEALPVAAGDQGQASVAARAAVEVQPDVQLLLRHAAVEEIAQTVGVPAEPGVHAPGHVQVAVENDAVLLPVADARALADEREDGREARVANERMHLVGEDRGEREALKERPSALVGSEEEGDAEPPRPPLGEPLRLDALHLGDEHRYLVGGCDAGEEQEPVLAEEGALLGGDAGAEREARGERKIAGHRTSHPTGTIRGAALGSSGRGQGRGSMSFTLRRKKVREARSAIASTTTRVPVCRSRNLVTRSGEPVTKKFGSYMRTSSRMSLPSTG